MFRIKARLWGMALATLAALVAATSACTCDNCTFYTYIQPAELADPITLTCADGGYIYIRTLEVSSDWPVEVHFQDAFSELLWEDYSRDGDDCHFMHDVSFIGALDPANSGIHVWIWCIGRLDIGCSVGLGIGYLCLDPATNELWTPEPTPGPTTRPPETAAPVTMTPAPATPQLTTPASTTQASTVPAVTSANPSGDSSADVVPVATTAPSSGYNLDMSFIIPAESAQCLNAEMQSFHQVPCNGVDIECARPSASATPCGDLKAWYSCIDRRVSLVVRVV